MIRKQTCGSLLSRSLGLSLCFRMRHRRRSLCCCFLLGFLLRLCLGGSRFCGTRGLLCCGLLSYCCCCCCLRRCFFFLGLW